jgi:RimJ/RimL family protein N-acetyltransferase
MAFRNDDAGDRGERFLVFRSQSEAWERQELDPGFEATIWRPSLTRIFAPSLGLRSLFWWAFHWAGVFRSRSYAVFVVRYQGTVVHRTVVLPAYFRWPFMGASDVQVATWTAPAFRGRGLAKLTLKLVVERHHDGDRKVWYVTRPSNAAALSVCRGLSFQYCGSAHRLNRFGWRKLGQFVLDEPFENDSPRPSAEGDGSAELSKRIVH